MQYILEEEFEDHIRLSIEIENCGKFGLKVLKNQDEPFIIEYHKNLSKKAIAKNIFLKHKIIVNNYVPNFVDLLDRATLKLFWKRELTKKDIICYLTRNNTLNYLDLIPKNYLKKENT